jgi:hypothetical protein
MTYNIDPAGVQGVLIKVSDAGDTLRDALIKLANVEEPLNAGLKSPLEAVAGAVSQFFEREQGTVSGMTNRMSAGLSAAAATSLAYMRGDEEMAANSVYAARQAAVDGNFDYFLTGEGRPGSRND